MFSHTLNMYGLYLIWAIGGLLLHIFLKLANARQTKPDFNVKIFIDKNLFQYIASFIAVLLICGLLAISPSQIKELPPVNIMGINLPFQFWLILIGYNGGSSLKNLLKRKANG